MLLKQNFKMQRSGGSRFLVYNFGIVAFRSASGFKTCPSAGECAKICYARRNLYTMGVVKAAKERYLLVSKAEVFVDIILSELEQLSVKAAKKKKKLAIRINDGGDFYDKAYLMKWLKIAAQSPNITFYAYTKEVALLKSVELPNNFIVAYSFGGKQDHLISESDRHALIFKSTYALKKAGYANASEDDTKVFGKNLKIGLVEH